MLALLLLGKGDFLCQTVVSMRDIGRAVPSTQQGLLGCLHFAASVQRHG